jgi:hypothetical protein
MGVRELDLLGPRPYDKRAGLLYFPGVSEPEILGTLICLGGGLGVSSIGLWTRYTVGRGLGFHLIGGFAPEVLGLWVEETGLPLVLPGTVSGGTQRSGRAHVSFLILGHIQQAKAVSAAFFLIDHVLC